jgi:hypothetical protein
MKLYPQCHPYWKEDGKIIKIKPQVVAYSAQGYLLPCCWCDVIDKKDFKEKGLLDDDLKLSKVNKLEDIIISKQWVNFHKSLLESPEKSPKVCKERCNRKIEHIIVEIKDDK